MNIPDDLRNRHRREIAELGLTIAPYVPPVPTGDQVNAERQRRIIAGAVIKGVHVTGRDEDIVNLTNLALAAQVRIAGGDTTTLTTYRDGGNVDHDLTPPQMLDLWMQASARVSAIYQTSWALKAMNPIPADFANDSYWVAP
ncbi:DUF4376 domain-containing protein [Ensifer sp. MPMI2T]|nr:DUF4376 domain-containing protein [Ensifer sp. MPMI2T]